MDPDGDNRVVTLKSPNFPSKYPNSRDCKWTLVATSGRVKMVLDKFNIEWSRSCKSKDYLFVGKIQKYTKTWLCGASIPSSFSSLKSKAQTMVVKFHSNNSIRKTGFKARFIATG